MIKYEGKKFLSDERLEVAFRSFVIKENLDVIGIQDIEYFCDKYKLTKKEKDYLIEKNENNCVYLSRTNKKIVYPFLEVSKLSDSKYEILFKDKNGKKIKRAVYKNGYVSGYNCFYEIEIHDLIFNKNTYFVYITNLIKKQKLPASLFNQNQMYNLITFIKQNGFITE